MLNNAKRAGSEMKMKIRKTTTKDTSNLRFADAKDTMEKMKGSIFPSSFVYFVSFVVDPLPLFSFWNRLKHKKYSLPQLALFLFVVLFLCACGNKNPAAGGPYGNYYEIFVASFYDSDGNGKGDLQGIIQKLDYLNDTKSASKNSLHVDGLWLMPIMPSPSYHKYDVTNYYEIDPLYGTMEDFENLITECKKRNVKVIIDLVMNHSSRLHPWFLAALEEYHKGEPGRYAAYYNISEMRPLSSWHSANGGAIFYEGDFSPDMPDLNFDNADVKEEFKNIVNFWIDKGVAGFRLDAVRHVYQDREKSVAFLKWFTEYCRSVKSDIYLVGEVWTDDAGIMAFYESGIPSLFNFPAATKDGLIVRSLSRGDGASFARGLIRWQRLMERRNAGAIDAPFISNHDNDRSAGYFSGKDAALKRKMAAAMYLFMPGNPFIYYGEEIAMEGSGRDENKRLPFVWDELAIQLADDNSLARFYVEAIKLKNKYPLVFSGRPEEIVGGDQSLAAYTLNAPPEFSGGSVAVVHNLSSEKKEIDLPGRKKIGGVLYAGAGKEKPFFRGNTLVLGAYSTVLVEMKKAGEAK